VRGIKRQFSLLLEVIHIQVGYSFFFRKKLRHFYKVSISVLVWLILLRCRLQSICKKNITSHNNSKKSDEVKNGRKVQNQLQFDQLQADGMIQYAL